MRDAYAMRKHSVQSRFSYQGNTRAVTEKRELHAFSIVIKSNTIYYNLFQHITIPKNALYPRLLELSYP